MCHAQFHAHGDDVARLIAFADAATAAGEEAYRRLLPDAPGSGLAEGGSGLASGSAASTGEDVVVPAKRARMTSSPDAGGKEVSTTSMAVDGPSPQSPPAGAPPSLPSPPPSPRLYLHLHLAFTFTSTSTFIFTFIFISPPPSSYRYNKNKTVRTQK